MTTELQIKIYNLVTSGRSYSSVAKEFGIGKTTVSTNYLKIKNGKEHHSEPSVIKNNEPVSTAVKDTITSKTSTVDYTELKNPPIDSTPDKNVPPAVILKGPLVELMEVLPPNFKGTIESHSPENASKFAWRFACFLSEHHTPIEIITDDLHRLKRSSEFDPGYDKIIVKNCITPEQVMNEIKRTTAGIIILDNIQTLKLSFLDWMKIFQLNPEKAIIGLRKNGLVTSDLHFVAKIDTNLLMHVNIKTKFGIQDFNMGFSASNLYTSNGA